MKIKQWIRCYNSKNNEFLKEWLLCEFEEAPEYWTKSLSIEYPVACALLGEVLDDRRRLYFLETDV